MARLCIPEEPIRIGGHPNLAPNVFGACLTEGRATVIKLNGDVAQTFLVDGFVAGIWRVDDGRVVLEPFEPLSAAARREIEDEAGRLEEFLGEP
jgi:DNA glycosylase AlkZ-like